MTNRTYQGVVVAISNDFIKVEYTARGKKRTTVLSKVYYDYESRTYKTAGDILNYVIEFDDINCKIRKIIN